MVICNTHHVPLLRKAVGRQPVLLLVVMVQGPVVPHHQAVHIAPQRNLIQVHFLSGHTNAPDSCGLDFELEVAFVLMQRCTG